MSDMMNTGEDTEDPEFEPSAEMLVHDDMDDELTLQEEEEMAEPQEVEEEVQNLQEESEMPLEQLLAMYGYSGTVGDQEEEEADEGEEAAAETEKHEEERRDAVLVEIQGHENPRESRVANEEAEKKLKVISCRSETETAVIPEELLLCKQTESDSNLALNTTTVGDVGSGSSYEVKLSPDQKESDVSSGGASSSSSSKQSEFRQHMDGERRSQRRSLYEANLKLALMQGQGSKAGLRSGSATPPLRGGGGKGRSRGDIATMRYRLRADLPERRSLRAMGNSTALDAYFAALLQDGTDDDYLPNEEWWKKEIKVDSEHQAKVLPAPTFQPYPKQPHENCDTLVWNAADSEEEEEVSYYLTSVVQLTHPEISDPEPVENEKALELLQKCGHDIDAALKHIDDSGLPSDEVAPWNEEERKKFEAGLRLVGKNFYELSKKVPTRTVKELVQFYYTWKKTEAHDTFIQQGRLGKKKLVCPPGYISDFMDRLMELQDPANADLLYATTTILKESKKDNT